MRSGRRYIDMPLKHFLKNYGVKISSSTISDYNILNYEVHRKKVWQYSNGSTTYAHLMLDTLMLVRIKLWINWKTSQLYLEFTPFKTLP